MKKFLAFAFMLFLCANLARAGWVNHTDENTKGSETIARFGIITDVHHTNKADTASRKYSAALAKMHFFVDAMNREKADFIIELGDFVDTLVEEKDPVQNLFEVESIFAGFVGPRYHVLGNHEFDNVERIDLLNYLENTDIHPGETYYSFDRNGIHCVVLDADYTNDEPHRPFDMIKPGETPWWNWKDAWIPREELEWLKADLAASNLPTVVFTHHTLHRDLREDHTVKNADVVRGILEEDGQVMAVFSGHDHRGEISIRNGIHYFVLEGNVGVSLDWSEVSPTEGLDPVKDSPFALVEIKKMKEEKNEDFGKMRTYQIILKGNAQQYTYSDQVQIEHP